MNSWQARREARKVEAAIRQLDRSRQLLGADAAARQLREAAGLLRQRDRASREAGLRIWQGERRHA